MAVDVVAEPRRRLFSIKDYVRMVEAGILTKHERVELIEGEIVEMSPIGNRHGAFVANLTHLLVRAVGDRAVVWPQGPVQIPPRSVPQPDFALLRPRSYVQAAATIKDVFLVIEVADSSLRFDTTAKLRLYARAGIPEYWVVDAKAQALTAYLEPTRQGYGRQRQALRGERIAPSALPDATIDVAKIFA